MNEKKVIERIKNGDKNSFSILYNSYKNEILAFFITRVKSREDALDLTSTCFEKALRYIESYNPNFSIRTWLYKIAQNSLYDFFKKQKSNFESFDEKFNIEQQYEQVDNSKIKLLKKILHSIPEKYKKVLELRYLLNFSVKETAIEMNTTESNIKVLCFRALKKAREIKNLNLN